MNNAFAKILWFRLVALLIFATVTYHQNLHLVSVIAVVLMILTGFQLYRAYKN